MSDETIWLLESHTRAKHEILRRYLDAWFPILTVAGFHKRVIFLDGFAGPGRYAGGEPGSPVIALDSLISNRAFPKVGATEFVMIFVEQDPARFASLEAEIEAFWHDHGGQPDNVKVITESGTFDETATGIFDSLDERGRTPAPTFAFIDPFGFKGVPLATIRRLLANDRTEVFFNFMYDSLNRWVAHPDDAIHVHLTDLFGCESYRDADGLPAAERRRFLHDLYRAQLEAAGCEFVRHFEMANDKGRLKYSLYFGTKHIKGLEVMKDAMWSVDPAAGIGFSGRLAGQDVLFEPEPDFAPLRAAILAEFSGQDVSIERIHRFVIVDTPYKGSHYKKQVLKVLQDEELLVPVTGQRLRGTYPDGCVVRFV